MAKGDRSPDPKVALTKDTLFGKRTLRNVLVDVPDYGVVTVQELMGYQRDELDDKLVKRELDEKTGELRRVVQDPKNYKARAITYALLNPDGTPMFPDGTEMDVKVVSELPGRVIDQLFDAVDSLSLLTKKAQDNAGKSMNGTGGNASLSKSGTSGAAPEVN